MRSSGAGGNTAQLGQREARPPSKQGGKRKVNPSQPPPRGLPEPGTPGCQQTFATQRGPCAHGPFPAGSAHADGATGPARPTREGHRGPGRHRPPETARNGAGGPTPAAGHRAGAARLHRAVTNNGRPRAHPPTQLQTSSPRKTSPFPGHGTGRAARKTAEAPTRHGHSPRPPPPPAPRRLRSPPLPAPPDGSTPPASRESRGGAAATCPRAHARTHTPRAPPRRDYPCRDAPPIRLPNDRARGGAWPREGGVTCPAPHLTSACRRCGAGARRL